MGALTGQMGMLETECANRVPERNLPLTEKRPHMAAAPIRESSSNEPCAGMNASRRRHARFCRTTLRKGGLGLHCHQHQGVIKYNQ